MRSRAAPRSWRSPGWTPSTSPHGQAEPEKVWRQYVSGEMFRAFGLRPAVGRLLGPQDDRQPGGHPVAVLSHDYWTRRFGQDRGAVGRAFRHGHHLYEIVGVAPAGFHGTEAGHAADLFVPTMMNVQSVEKPDWGWVGVLAMVEPGASPTRSARNWPPFSNGSGSRK